MTDAPLSWNMIALGATAPMVLSLLVAYPFWRKEQMIFGNVIGTAVIFAFTMTLVFREFVEIDMITTRCLEQGTTCYPRDSFLRFAIYASIGLLEIFALFYASLRVEERRRRRLYAPEWRR